MEFRDVQGFEVVIGRFDFGALDDGEAYGEEDVFDLLKDLTNQMVRADGTNNSWKGEVNTLAGTGRLVGAGFDGFAALFDFRFDVGAKLIQLLADDALEFLSSRLEPVIGDLRQHPGFAAQPSVAELLPGRFVASARTFLIEASAKIGEERREFLGPSDAEVDQRQPRFVFRRAHIDVDVGERRCARAPVRSRANRAKSRRAAQTPPCATGPCSPRRMRYAVFLSCGGAAALAFAASWPKAAASRTARSARTLRSSVTPAAFRP